jgi:hypothetical protein
MADYNKGTPAQNVFVRELRLNFLKVAFKKTKADGGSDARSTRWAGLGRKCQISEIGA